MAHFEQISGSLSCRFFNEWIATKFNSPDLIPKVFATPKALLFELNWYKTYINSHQQYLDNNFAAGNHDQILDKIQSIKNEFIDVIEHSISHFNQDDSIIPHQELRIALTDNNVDKFIEILKAILASVSYAISRSKEDFFHSNVHLILKLSGIDITSEEMTSDGRIDAVIRSENKIYILEFKFHKHRDLSDKALQQIKDKGYKLKFLLEKKDVFGVGISFSIEKRNINGYKIEKLN